MNREQMASACLARMERARSDLIRAEPFLGSLAMRLRHVIRWDIPTACTDGRVIAFNPEFVLSLSERACVGLEAHELMHCALRHFDRAGLRPIKQWNVATDHAINLELIAKGYQLPSRILADKRFTGLSAETIYAELFPDRPKQQEPDDADSDDGSADDAGEDSDGPSSPGSDPGEDDADGDDADGSSGSAGEGSDAGEGEGSPTDADGSGDGSASEGEDGDGSADVPSSPGSGEGSGAGNNSPASDGSADQGGPAGDSGPAGHGSGSGEGDGADGPSSPAGDGSASDSASSPRPAPDYGNDWGGVAPAGSLSDPEPGEVDAGELSETWKVYVKQAVSVAKKRHGTLPGWIQRIADDSMQSAVDWRAALRQFVDASGIYDYAWSRPNRRFVGSGLYLPGKVPDSLNHVAVIFDTSCSLCDVAESQFTSELRKILDDGLADEITFICCDTRITKVEKFQAGENPPIVPLGGGGTDFAPAIEYVNENCPDVSAVIFFTDLECNSFGTEPQSPVLWIRHGSGRYATVPPWGEVIPLDPFAG